MSNPFQTIGLIAKSGAPAVAQTLTKLIDDLRQRELHVVLDESAAVYFERPEEAVLNRWELAKGCDLAIVIGGDGTLLNAARSLAEANVPVLGVNLGRLGFLADVSPDEMHERLDEILAGQYDEEHRSLLHASVLRDGRSISESDALNDVVIHKWDIARMIEVDTTIDGRFLNSLRADGLIVATPTGCLLYTSDAADE